MNTRAFARRDFADTLAVSAGRGHWPLGPDALEQMAENDRDDWVLLRLVLCATAATVLLALACSLAAA